MFERFTEKARRALFFARYEASQFGSPCVETQHLLLGLLREDKQLANRFLGSHSVVDSIRKQIEGHSAALEKIATSVDLPLSHECKRVLAYTSEEAERLNYPYIGTEHILLGLLREEKGVAAGILHENGLRLSDLREELRTSAPPPVRDVRRRAASTFTLTAVNPKLDRADPSNPTGFQESSGLDKQRLIVCRNMTMAQFVENLPWIAPGYIRRGTVLDATGLHGAWDFTLSFSIAGMAVGDSVSLFEAVEQQLGLKLETVKSASSPVFSMAEILIRATWLAGKVKASEIGMDILLLALDPEIAIPDQLSDLPTGESGSYDRFSLIGFSSEVKAAIAPSGGFTLMTTDSLRQVLLAARRNRA